MMNLVHYFLLLFCLFIVTHGKNLPKYLKTCKRSDENYYTCLKESIQHTVSFMRGGINGTDIRKIEPITLQPISFEFPVRGIPVKVLLNESIIDNLSYFSIAAISATDNCYKIDLIIPYAKLEANGSLVTPFTSADGILYIDGVDIELAMDLCGEEIKDKHKKCQFHFNKLDIKIDLDEFNAKITCGDRIKETLINLTLNLTNNKIVETVIPFVTKKAKVQLLETIQMMTDGYACEDLRPH